MRKVTAAMQAAVVTMLVAKRPALDKLPIRWELRPDGRIYVDEQYGADPAVVPQIAAELARAMRGAKQIAAELARAMRGAKTNTYEMPEDGGTITRAHQVEGQPNGVRVEFHSYERGIQPSETAAGAEGGETA
ncbi:hypothetical protein [Streptomyces sp. NPDC057877]|uniref:hypothetical protein n=1 Tax=Streptomyces sp. NPDC057877 TaxID=3346269 RepID=UPI0036749AAB